MINITSEEKNILTNKIVNIYDYPIKGVVFRDITPLLANAQAYNLIIEKIAKTYKNIDIDYIVAIEARGFILGGALAYKLNTGFIPLRKRNKLPREVLSINYGLEYGENILEIHKDDLPNNARILLIDDVLATGGSALAAINLLQQLQVKIISSCFLIDLKYLGGKKRLQQIGIDVKSVLEFN
ncbi:adenine phosphoribosyltransferase [Bartonella sp. DGB1]|uniref:adenine phosphoribosyltransferase n=1 Tax=Bartonella sp. DGB1 TaxID=3239807 RepID=UPI003523E8F5